MPATRNANDRKDTRIIDRCGPEFAASMMRTRATNHVQVIHSEMTYWNSAGYVSLVVSLFLNGNLLDDGSPLWKNPARPSCACPLLDRAGTRFPRPSRNDPRAARSRMGDAWHFDALVVTRNGRLPYRGVVA